MEKKSLIMLIDDEKDLVDMLSFQFQAKGYDTVTASNGLEGLEMLNKVRPDLIVLDLNMPKMGGIEFYQKICGSDGRPAYPVLVLTARANMEQLFKDLEIDGFMAKPFDVDQLIQEAEIIIKKKAQISKVVQQDKKSLLRSVYVIENDQPVREEIALALLRAGYRVACASTGTSGLELLSLSSPQLAVVNLGLPDIAGDVVALRALRMAKTSGVLFLLYEKRDPRRLQVVREQIGHKTGIMDLIEYETAQEIVGAVNSAIQRGLAHEAD